LPPRNRSTGKPNNAWIMKGAQAFLPFGKDTYGPPMVSIG
jgi:hypothetical protein